MIRWFSKDFPLGRAPVVMALLFIASLPFVWMRPSAGENALQFWVFANTHYDEYKERVKLFERQRGVKVNLQLIPGNVLVDKLLAAFLSNTGAPDLAEIEINQSGRFFLGRKSDVGFVDVTERLKREGVYEQIVKTRFVPWSHRGSIYGVPHDVHPVVLLYRTDLLGDLTAEFEKIETWDDFVAFFRKHPRLLDPDDDGKNDKSAVMLWRDLQAHLRLLLLQSGEDYFDAQGNVRVDTERLHRVAGWMRDMFLKHDMAFAAPPFGPDLYGPMKENRLYCVLAADWFVGLIKKFAPELKGKYRAMPLPAWTKGGRRTSTWGGTMIGLTKQSKRKELAWELLKFLYFDQASARNRYEQTKIITSYKPAWRDSIFQQPDDFVDGNLGVLLTTLADDVPPVYQNQFSSETILLMNTATYKILNEKDTNVSTPLKEVMRKVRERMAKDRFKKF
jgi:arabinosaccharide transport system substrate-binding protein